ncbi:unnamed protein product [Blepharisma stoltei]|uniref:protein-serine/threonine phosphatase n=1 Tax=Blepharisma stoltei TaxID=1481888 RepID=A0AAU9JTW3_9CILI|nr:unnamed protein product [Blepharisma stoltei]
MSEIPIKPPQIPNLVIKQITWHVKLNEFIEEGHDLCTLICDVPESSSSLLSQIIHMPVYKTKTFKIKSTASGSLYVLNSAEEAQQTSILCKIRQKTLPNFSIGADSIDKCKHEMEFGGMCAFCGYRSNENEQADIEKLHCGVTGRNLKFNEDLAVALEHKKKQKLLKEKKLLLVLDLDHTLLHTIKGSSAKPNIHQINIDGIVFSTRLRPHLDFFLENLKDKYEFFVYTKGSRKYAHQMMKLIDPHKEYFGERLISQDDEPGESGKSLKILLPKDNTMVLILDDTHEVWPDSPNLVIADRFWYFYDELSDIDKKIMGENDHLLYFMKDLLANIHDSFYMQETADVKNILKQIQGNVLLGAKIAFSGMIPIDIQPEMHPLWQAAERYGAICQREVTEETTHLISDGSLTKKFKQAKRMNIPVLHRTWLSLSVSYWYWLPESQFTLENINNLDIRSLLPTSLMRQLSIGSPVPSKSHTSGESESDSDSDLIDSKSDSSSSSNKNMADCAREVNSTSIDSKENKQEKGAVKRANASQIPKPAKKVKFQDNSELKI